MDVVVAMVRDDEVDPSVAVEVDGQHLAGAEAGEPLRLSGKLSAGESMDLPRQAA
jgi:hypothetical protein